MLSQALLLSLISGSGITYCERYKPSSHQASNLHLIKHHLTLHGKWRQRLSGPESGHYLCLSYSNDKTRIIPKSDQLQKKRCITELNNRSIDRITCRATEA